MAGFGLPPNKKAKTANQGAGEPNPEGFGAKDAPPPIGEEQVSIKR